MTNKKQTISLGLTTTIQPPETDYSLILYLYNGYHERNIHYLCSRDIYFYTTYNMSGYYVTYDTIGQTHPGISTAANMDEYSPPKKGI